MLQDPLLIIPLHAYLYSYFNVLYFMQNVLMTLLVMEAIQETSVSFHLHIRARNTQAVRVSALQMVTSMHGVI